jgi:hypothetical protein
MRQRESNIIVGRLKPDRSLSQEIQMRRSSLSTLFGVAMVVLFLPQDSGAQSGAPPKAGAPKQEPVIQELLGEVRQLRIALQQISVNAYRGQVLVERLRLQQEQVNRLTMELNTARNQILEVRSNQIMAKSKLDEAEKQRDTGIVSEPIVARHREALEDLKRREQRLSEQETQMSLQLETERANLTELNRRLDALETEMMVTGKTEEPRGRIKR